MSELNWAQPLLGDVAEVIDPHPSHRAPPEVEGGVPFVGIGDLTTSGEVLASSARKVSPRVLDEHKTRYSVALGDIAYGRVATVGKVMRFGEISEPFALSPTMALIKPHGVSASYLAHFLQSKEWDDESAKLLTGTTRSSLGIQLLRKIRISCPRTFEEQTTIGGVLDTLDTAIRETEALIDKLKAVKQGLLHDLLTRGIDANGQLRPPQSEAPQLYKKSPLGWIPRDWEAGKVTNYLDSEQGIKPGPFGSSIKKESYADTGFKIYGQEQVIGGDQDLGEYFVPLRKYQELQDFSVKTGDVLISLVGTIGKVLVLKAPLQAGLINPRLMRLRPDQRIADSEFVGFLVASDFFVSQVFANAGGGTMPVINKRIISNIHAPFVPLTEQIAILKVKAAIDRRIDSELIVLAKLRQQKNGLMDDLLTGRVRVTPLLESVQQPAAPTEA